MHLSKQGIQQLSTHMQGMYLIEVAIPSTGMKKENWKTLKNTEISSPRTTEIPGRCRPYSPLRQPGNFDKNFTNMEFTLQIYEKSAHYYENNNPDNFTACRSTNEQLCPTSVMGRRGDYLPRSTSRWDRHLQNPGA